MTGGLIVNIVIRNAFRAEAELTDAELASLGVPFEELDYANVETRRVLQTVLGEIRDAGADISLSGRVLIEAFRLPAGCRLCFSVLPPHGDGAPSVKQLVLYPRTPVLFSGRSEGSLRRSLACLGDDADCNLYRGGETFFLYVARAQDEAALLRAAEFCEMRPADGALTPAFLAEHFIPLPRDGA